MSARAIATFTAALFIGGAIAYACAGPDDSPTWSLAKANYDGYGNSALLVPGNDTRTNLLLLLADARPSAAAALQPVKGPPFFGWAELRANAAPADPNAALDIPEPSRCQTLESGARAFIAAVRASGRLSASEKSRLIAARQALKPRCEPQGEGTAYPDLTSPAAAEFVTYLEGAEDFYTGDFDAAATRFGRLARASDPWLRETAAYMAGRTPLNKAIDSGFDEYGFLEPTQVDRSAVQAARAGFEAYLSAYPKGLYARSASGLMRRVHWLAGDGALLGRSYESLFTGTAAPSARGDVALIDEIDSKLFEPRSRPDSPLLLAVSDLQRMRGGAGQITKAEIEGQRGAFAGREELFDYLRAAEAYYVRGAHREVLQIIPDRAKQKSFTYLQFSRQMLRGFALAALNDRNTRGFLNELFAGANRPWQRDAVELALAMHDERTGNLAAVFAPASPVRNGAIRELLLSRIAGPELLRQQALQGPTKREREAALYLLLAKELGRGRYGDFLKDMAMVPAGASPEGYYVAPHIGEGYDAATIPLGMFVRPVSLGGYGCGPLAQTVGVLAARPTAARERLCLAEFFRENGFDWWEYDRPLKPGSLGGTRPLFPGTPYSRLEVYKAVIADGSATPEDKAFALYRAIRCYAPTGSNSCGGTDVALAQRKAWYDRLKASYPQSQWAKSLKYYW